MNNKLPLQESSNRIQCQVQLNNQNGKIKRERRTREQAGDGKFICGCKKTYLSYPALYLHIKNKHNGNTPEGTLLPNQNSKGFRGRPKKDFKLETELDAIEQLLFFLSQLQNQCKVQLVDPFIDNLISEENALLNLGIQNMPMDQQIYQVLCQNFPDDLYQLPNDFQIIKENFQFIHKQNGNLPLIHQNLHQYCHEMKITQNIKENFCNMIFSFFLYQIGKFITPECFMEISYYILIYRYSLNRLGWDKLRIIRPDQLQYIEEAINKQLEYCDYQNGENIIEVCNEFITQFLCKFVQQISQQKLYKFHFLEYRNQIHLKNCSLLMQHFSNWLFVCQFTNSKIRITQDELNQND